MKRNLLPFVLSLAAASTAHAQINPNNRQGPGSALAAGLSLDVPAGQERTLVKAPGNQLSPPTQWQRSQFQYGPDFSLQAMFSALAADIEIDAHSTGNDVIPKLDAQGVPHLTRSGQESWLGVVVSMGAHQSGADAQGLPGSNVERARNSGRSNRSDLFSFYFDESSWIHPTLRGTALVEQSREDLGFPSGGTEDIDALDFGLGVTSFAGATTPSLFFSRRGDFFFSVTPACVPNLGSKFALNGNAQEVPADPGVVYHITWSPALGWSPKPSIYRTLDELGLDDGDDLDALAVDMGNDTTVFSTQLVAGRSQLLVHDVARGNGHTELQNHPTPTTKAKTTTKIGSIDDTDDIDAVCIYDPRELALGTHMGTPTGWADLTGVGQPLGISITRAESISEDGREALLIQTTGWGGTTPSNAQVFLWISADYDPLLPWSNATWHLVDTTGKPRRLAENATEFIIDIPPNVSMPGLAFMTVLVGAGVEASWISQVNL